MSGVRAHPRSADPVPDAPAPRRPGPAGASSGDVALPPPDALPRPSPNAEEEGLDVGVAELREGGWLAAALPIEAGGAGIATSAEPAAVRRTLDVLRSLGRADLALARLYEGHLNAVKLVALHAAPALARETFDAVAGGALLGVWGAVGARPLAVSETGRTRWTLTGEKVFASGLGLVERAVVTVADPGVPTTSRLLLVDVDDPPRQHPEDWRASGMRATRSGRYRFDGIALPRARVLGGRDVYQREPWFEGGTWRYVAAQVGAMEGLVDAMLAELLARGRADDPHQSARVGRAATLAVGARALVERAAHEVESSDPADTAATSRAVALALLARESVEESAVALLTIVERALGMAAFARGHPLERRRRDLGLYLRQAAPDAKLARAAATLAGDAERGIGRLW